ncbi:MAG TPA: BTAD domain-containing putative transcriptional regulator [Solirubrobacteraceae bacterium]|nr:BTAD domain-containing putative transcriptional regulator [Solirubrobacteraceae bacterium]
MIKIRILGPVEVGTDGHPVPVGGRKQLKLFALLVVHANQAVSSDVLIDTVWGSAGSGADNRLQMAIARLRKVLEPLTSDHGPMVRTVGGGYMLVIAPGELDADVFAELVADGRRSLKGGDPERGVELLDQALRLWRGPPLADVSFEDFAQATIRELEELRLSALDTRVEALLELGRHAEVIGELEARLARHPTREAAAEQLMLALYRSGRQADALDVYQRTRERLDELGLLPGSALKELEKEILDQTVPVRNRGDPARRPQGLPTEPPQRDAVVPLPVRVQPYRPSAFVGRRLERDVLIRALNGTRVSGRRAAFVTGEPGIGKTRLVSEIASEAFAQGRLVLAGRCDAGLDVPYQPFVEALEHYVEHADTELLSTYVATYGKSLARLVPALATRLSEEPPDSVHASESELLVLYRAIEGLLTMASTDRAVLLILEDLHWGDVPTVKLLRQLLTSTRRSPLMLLSTCRLTELGDDHPLRELLADLYNEAHVLRVNLRGLHGDDLVELVRGIVDGLPDGPDRHLALALDERTNGNPFFITELVRGLVESGVLFDDGGGWRIDDGLLAAQRLPLTISEMLARRLHRLGSDVRRCLSVASVIGVEFDLDLVSTASDRADTADALDAAAADELVIEVPSRPTHFRFTHALTQQYLYNEIGAARRADVHRRVAIALEIRLKKGRAPAAELARHWLAAGDAQADNALRYSILAGDEALAKLAPDDARRWYQVALESLAPEAAGSEEQRCDLLISRGIAERQAGAGSFRETLLEAGEIARRIGDRDRLVACALANTRGMQSETGVVDEARIAILEAALRVVGDHDSIERALLLAMEGAELMYSRHWDRRVSLSDEALSIGRRLGDPSALITVLNLRFVALLAPATLGERRANTVEAVAVAERLSDPLARFYAYHWRAYACIEAGDMIGARSWAGREREIADRYRQPTTLWLATADAANLAIVAGDLQAADQLAASALEIGRNGEPDALACYAAQRTSIAFEAGRVPELVPLLEQAVAANPGVPGFRATLALALAEDSRLDGAQTILTDVAASGFADLPYDVTWLAVMCIYAYVSSAVQDAAAAEAIYKLLKPWRTQVVFPAFGVWGPVELYLGALALVMGSAAAGAHLSKAAEVAHRAQAPRWEARIAALRKRL